MTPENLPTSMRAIRYSRHGGPEVIEIGEMPVPKVGPDQVLIEVSHAAINPADVKERDGRIGELCLFPYVPGFDCAGKVAAIGTGVTQMAVGDEVISGSDHLLGDWGSFARFVRVNADHVGPKPASLSPREAATIPVAGRTAWQALFAAHKAALKEGDSVLFHGGSGGTGSFGVQFAKAMGLRVVATCSSSNVDYLRGLGADLVVDYTSEEIGEAVRHWCPDGLDGIVDAVSGGTLPDPLAMLRPGGRLFQIATATDDGDIAENMAAAEAQGKVWILGICDFDGAWDELAHIGALFNNGAVKCPPIQEVAMEDLASAQKAIGTGHTRGKIVMEITA